MLYSAIHRMTTIRSIQYQTTETIHDMITSSQYYGFFFAVDIKPHVTHIALIWNSLNFKENQALLTRKTPRWKTDNLSQMQDRHIGPTTVESVSQKT